MVQRALDEFIEQSCIEVERLKDENGQSIIKSDIDIQIIEKPATQSFQSVGDPETPKHNEVVHRRLKPRHIQLIGIGGTIGTSLFVQMGGVLIKGGPASLFIAYAFWIFPVLALTSGTAEMVTLYPYSSPFIRLSGRFIDEAAQVAAGYSYFILEAILVPFEITALTVIIHYWRDDFTPVAVILPQLALYVLINLVVPVNWFGEVEYWMAITKVLLIVGLILFTFITMVGGNPQHHAYGFSAWNNPGAFNEYVTDGSMGRFLGFMACLSLASYTVAGPDYVAMTAGEAVNPRKTLRTAFKGVSIRLSIFFAVGSLAMGIVCPSNDPDLLETWNSGATGTAAASPYVAGMKRLGITVLPDIVNVGILLSAFSAGNSYFYSATRVLYGLACDGHAPGVFRWCTKSGVPYMSALVVLAVSMLAFLQMSQSATDVLNYIVSIGTSCQLIIYSLINIAYIRFHKACEVQGLDRRTLPYRGWWQPYQAWFSLFFCSIMLFCAGHSVFLKGHWAIGTFITNYVMIPFAIIVFVFWKWYKKTTFKRAADVDLISGLAAVAEYEKHVVYHPPRNRAEKLWRVIIGDA